MNQPLIDAVLDQIKEDCKNGDVTAIEELLRYVPEKNLLHYLPEQLHPQFEDV